MLDLVMDSSSNLICRIRDLANNTYPNLISLGVSGVAVVPRKQRQFPKFSDHSAGSSKTFVV